MKIVNKFKGKYVYIYIIYRGGLLEYIYPKKLQFAAYGQFVLVLIFFFYFALRLKKENLKQSFMLTG